MSRAPKNLASVLAATTLTVSFLAAAPAGAAPPPSADDYNATIDITQHGIPHITADDWPSLGYGSGWAAAGEATCTLADVVVTGRGQRSRYFGPDARYNDQVQLQASNLEVDTVVLDMHNREVVEKLLDSPAGPSARTKAMVRGYADGVNEWLRTNDVTDPECADSAFLADLDAGVTALDIWYGVYLSNLLASTGVFISDIANASPPSLSDPGLPDIPGALGLPELPTTKAEVHRAASKVNKDELMERLGKDVPFGSNATAIGGDASSTGKGMLLGNPHFPWRGRYRFTQQHLTIPGEYDVAGASLIGSPAVNIGWNDDVAWSHTVSTAYRFTPYEYTTLGPGRSYLTPSGVKEAEHRTVEVPVLAEDGSVDTVTEDVYRTDQGYVTDSPGMLMSWSPVSFWAIRDANAEHLRTLDTFLDMGSATSVDDLLARQDRNGGMPWVNTIAADRTGDALYADHSVVPHVTNERANRCMTVTGRLINAVSGLPGLNGNLADDTCAWGSDADAQRGGILGPQHLPDVQRRDWVMNANDSYWLPNPDAPLEGYPSIIGCEQCERTMRTRMVSQYVIDQLSKTGRETPSSLRKHQYANRQRTVEVMRDDGALSRVCDATGETDACDVLAGWDGTSNRDAVGTHIFAEFIQRAPTGAQLWKVPFSADDPLNTPRELRESPAVVSAMKDAITSLRDAGIPFDASWGSLQVAGDRGAPALPLGGGEGNRSGNANALGSSAPEQNAEHYRPVTYGSSHIQAIAFKPGGRVDARTILTYGQYEDPGSPWSSDQTELFSNEKWVRFPWTDAQIRSQLVDTVTLTE